ncbi:hypothetical protein ACH5RR_018343 [Cinchona calisaya]|uniref:Uncharacterized protein n=1 Tax=Cinchona calisaya TaxID=153742 RepID=A0ABD2ZLQ5_9GENT
MGHFILSNPLLSSPPLTTFSRYKTPVATSSTRIPDNKTVNRAFSNGLSIFLSFGLLFSSPPSFSLSIAHALDWPSAIRSSTSVSLMEKNPGCREEEEQEERTVISTPQVVSNEGIVEEAWEIVHDSFLDTTNRRRWSPETWLQKKVDLLGMSYQTRSKAHDVIRRMLASLGDPYTRFLSPTE